MGLFRKKKVDVDINGRPIIEKKKERKGKRNVDEIAENPTLSNVIAPLAIDFYRNDAVIGENKARAYGIISYPQEAGYGWLRRMSNIHGTVSVINFRPLNTMDVIKSLDANVKNYRLDAMDAQKEESQRQRAEASVENAEKTIKRINQNNEVVGAMSTVLMPLAETDKDFEKLCTNVENTAKISGCRPRKMTLLQKEALQFILPTYSGEPMIEKQLERMVPLSAFFGGFPFASSGWNDNNGFYRGHDGLGGTIIVDSWVREGDRTNSNYVLAGDAGQGKSSTIKMMALMEYVDGASLIFIDPEGEYRHLTEKLGGQWLNAAGGNGKVINPLQIIVFPKDDEDEEAGQMEQHFKTLEVFLQLYRNEISQRQLSLLKQVIEAVYKDFGITWATDVSSFKPKDFPVFKDVYDYLKNQAELAKQHHLPDKQRDFEDLALLLYDVAEGSDYFLWGQHTTLEFTSKVICVDTSGLNSAPSNIKTAQYYLLQLLSWVKATANRKTRDIIVYDEAHMIIDKDTPGPMKTLSTQERRSRKYEVAIWVASQQINDFIDPEIKKDGQAILDQPTYKVIHGMSGQGLSDLTQLYHLKPTEQELVERKTRGRALFIIGSRKVDLSVVIDETKLSYFGDRGGR